MMMLLFIDELIDSLTTHVLFRRKCFEELQEIFLKMKRKREKISGFLFCSRFEIEILCVPTIRVS